MPLIKLEISDFRNIESILFEPVVNGFNIIYGDNGSGKTSILESIYYLSLGRSFRSATISPLIRNLASQLAIYSNVFTPTGQAIPVGIQRRLHGGLSARLAGENVKGMAEIASLLPVQLINSNCYNLLDAGPGFRRKYIDWGAFYHTPDFLPAWRQYKHVLKQRNAALAARVSKKELEFWNSELFIRAMALHQLRVAYVQELLPLLIEMVAELLILTDLKIEYYPGWEIDQDYQQILIASLGRDLQLGYTQFGPHRANLNVVVNQFPAKDILSRGQQKLFVCAMMLAQGALLFRSKNRKPIYLVDDLPSELDMKSRFSLLALLSRQEAQIFVTAVEHNVFKNCLGAKPTKLFHVEHGCLKQTEWTKDNYSVTALTE